MDIKIIKQVNQEYFEISNVDFAKSFKDKQKIKEKLQLYLEQCKKNDPYNIEIIFRLAIIMYSLYKSDRGVAYVDAIPIDHLLYPKSLLIRTFIYEELFPIEEKDYKILIAVAQKVTDLDMKLMLLYAACYYWKLTTLERKSLLTQSVKYCSSHAWNLQHLSSIYFQEDNKIEGRKLLIKARDNITEVSEGYISGDITDPDEFINRNIKGIYTSPSFFTSLVDSLDRTK